MRLLFLHRPTAIVGLLIAGLLALVALACTSEAAPSDATPTPPPAASPAPVTPTAVPGDATPRTGVASVDRALAAVAAKDAVQLASLARLEPLACTTAMGLGGPPACGPGEAPGTVVNVLFTSSCDGHYIRQTEVEPLMKRFVEDRGKLAGVYRHNGLIFPSSQYVLVFSFDTPYGSLARVLFVSDTGIVGVTFACGSSAKEYVEAVGLRDAVLLPN